ncbi:hypothetical protein ABMA28_003467 [Loxostege sticticalis]|uniref:ISXO2-like transposase domain-containing protein n=1 Tax=Loxostege sticticalis TaxID=481309 RepID=A0ABD0SWF9_LOXSC
MKRAVFPEKNTNVSTSIVKKYFNFFYVQRDHTYDRSLLLLKLEIDFNAESLLPREKTCWRHRRNMSVSRASGEIGKFRCYKSNCRTKSESRAIGTWFEGARLSLTLIFQIMYAFSEGLSYTQTKKECATDDTVLSARTIADWFSYCRETIVIYELENQENRPKIGGPGKNVQIDEGRHIEGHWVIGMIEDGNDDLRLKVCPDNERSAEVLVPLIQKHVQEGSIIHTDYWRAYMSLPEYGYIHRRVNHSDPTHRFVAPDGTHTQRIESQWRGLKKAFRQQQHKHDFTDWLCEYSWRRRIRMNHMDPYEELLKAIKHVYRL